MYWYRSKFVGDVIRAASGNTVANLLMLGALPFLSRLYSPAEFGVFSIFFATSMILSAIASAKYELAIPIAKSESEAWHILILSLGISLFVPVITLISLSLWQPAVFTQLGRCVYLLPFCIFFDAFSRVFSFWLTRKGEFSWLAFSRIMQVLSVISLQISLENTFAKGQGLVIGFFAGGFVLVVLNSMRVYTTCSVFQVSRKQLLQAAVEHKHFPKYLLLAHGGATMCTSIPTFFLGAFYGEATAGFFAMAMRVIDRPVQLIGQAIFQVFYPEASRQFAKQGQCVNLFVKTSAGVFLIGLCLLAAIYASVPWSIQALFGEQWLTSGVMIQWLAPLLILQLLHCPVSGMFMIAHKQHIDLMWTLFRLLLVVAGLFAGLIVGGMQVSIIGLSIAGSISYGVHWYLSYRFAHGEQEGSSHMSRNPKRYKPHAEVA